tara:strand:+ start:3960 stop:4466 length:507 start_codon:yes stop_codon:yes gene_type:complete
MINKDQLLEMLNFHKYNYKLYSHPPLSTVEESKKLRGEIDGPHTKNLFLKNKKSQFFLISCLESSTIKLKNIAKTLNLGNISFAKEDYLKKILNVAPGSVSPFGLLNDNEKRVDFYFDSKLNEFENFNFHPLDNKYTVNINKLDFYNLFAIKKIKINIINLEEIYQNV